MHEDYLHNPCVLNDSWYRHCQRYPSPEDLLSSDSKAETCMRADEADLDTIDVETGNTVIHRCIKRGLQQKLANMEDIGASFVMVSDRAIHTDPLGVPAYTAEEAFKRPKENDKSGGGGLARACANRVAPD